MEVLSLLAGSAAEQLHSSLCQPGGGGVTVDGVGTSIFGTFRSAGGGRADVATDLLAVPAEHRERPGRTGPDDGPRGRDVEQIAGSHRVSAFT